MKKTFVIKGLIAILLVFIFAFAAVGCGNDDVDLADKTVLNQEIAINVNGGDFTADSYSAYSAKLSEAKAVANNKSATQQEVDSIAEKLKGARLSLVLKPIEEVEGGKRAFELIPGESFEITLSDYVNTNGLSKIDYKVKTSNAVVDISPISDGKFTVTAGGVRKPTDLTVSIFVNYDGVEKLKVDLSVHISNNVPPTLIDGEPVREYDLLTMKDMENLILDFSENINNPGGIEIIYTAKMGDDELLLDGSVYTMPLGTYTEQFEYKTFNVTATYIKGGEEYTLEYTYTVGIRDTGIYGVVNGSFDYGLDGWTLIGTVGEASFGGIDNSTSFWGEGYAMYSVGNYFSSYAPGAAESSQGTLASPYFVVNSDFATYMLGGAGNPNVYIIIENKNGEVLALYRNTAFADFPAGEFSVEERREMIGNTVFLANFVTYKVSLSDFMGEEVRFVIHDHASEGWGVVFFDELITYYSSEEALPEGAILAQNLIANKTALDAEIALEVTDGTDFTADTYNAYLLKLDEAKAIFADAAATQAAVDKICTELENARLALAVRDVFEVEGASKTIRLASGQTFEITLSDYVNINGLKKISYGVMASNANVTVGEVVNGKLTVSAAQISADADATVTISVYYEETLKLSIDILCLLTSENKPTVIVGEVNREYDVYTLDNKANITVDLSENIYNAAGIELVYTVNYGGADTILEGSIYTFALGSYTDKVTYEILTVTATYTQDGEEKSINYTCKLAIKDTTANRLANGGFENGLDGWDKVGNIGEVSSDTNYWVNEWENGGKGYEFGMDGEKMFSAYAPGAFESAVGTLTSSTFTVGGSGFITFKVGAMKDGNYVYIDVVDAKTKQILARYYNGLWSEYTGEVKSGCTLIAYKANLSEFMGKEVFFRISDNADSGYGLFFLDSFNTYYEAEPEGFNDATKVNYEISGTIYDVFNGGFEMGDVQGWWNNGEPGHVTDADAFFSGVSYGKDGNFLYSGVEDFGAGNGKEGNRGTLTSSTFEIGGTGFITFMLGGGGNSLCYVQVIDSTTGEILARYHQQAMQDAVLVQYIADLSAYIGRTARIVVVDQAENGWGCVSFDNVVTYYASSNALPAGILAEDIKANIVYTIENGSFEDGLNGWSTNITEPGEHNTLGWVQDTEIDAEWYAKNDETKDGSFLFTFVTVDNVNCEGTKGTLQSSSFSLKQGAFVSFKFGGAGNTVNHDVYIELCRADGSVIARFYNDAEGKVNTRMNAYFYQYGGTEVECFFRVVDNSTSDYGCFVVDDFRVNLDAAPEGYVAAIQ